MAQPAEFKDFIPGMEYFQTLLKGAGLSSQFASWVAPTLDVQEIEQRITDLKAVAGWLEANARMTQNMIQALEVQRMTLQALRSMNVDMQAFAQGLAAEPPPKASDTAQPAQSAAQDSAAPPAQPAAAPLFDPLQWWNAVTQQFTELASKAMQDSGALQAGSAAPGAASTAGNAPSSTGPRAKATAAKKAAPRSGRSAARRAAPK
ncbi:MAG: PhaM family polyhydroxyalkanoate granule multifunctional regulatory protein [Thiomonas sp.]|jgi:hypothetical protein